MLLSFLIDGLVASTKHDQSINNLIICVYASIDYSKNIVDQTNAESPGYIKAADTRSSIYGTRNYIRVGCVEFRW